MHVQTPVHAMVQPEAAARAMWANSQVIEGDGWAGLCETNRNQRERGEGADLQRHAGFAVAGGRLA